MGGFGEVYRATMRDPDGVASEVAVKILHPGIDPTAQAIQRLQDEARLLGLLQHPSIIRVVDLLQYKGRLSLVTEYVDGEDLSACFGAVPPPSPRAMLEVVGRVANALDAAWRTPSPDGSGQLQLIHRDLKPSNIRISKSGNVKLLDFGLAHADHADRQAQTEANVLLGSFLYMAPERYLQQPATSASDAFALGCCLFEGLAGEKLFEGRKPVDLYGLLLDAEKWDQEMDDRVASIPSTVNDEARQVCRRLLDRDPEQRMTVTELADTWEDLVEAMTGPTLRKWAHNRDWPEPQPVRASLEGSVVASRILPVPPPPDTEEEDDDAPTVRVRADRYQELLGDLDASAQPTAESAPRRPGHASGFDDEPSTTKQVTRKVDRGASTAPMPRGDATAPMPHGQATEPMPHPNAGQDASPRRMNWLGAGLLATTTVVVTAVVVALAVVVLVTWWTRAPRGDEAVQHAPPNEEPQAADADAHVQVDGVGSAWLTRGRRRIETGDVPAGMWTLWVDFGDGPAERMGTMRVPKGERVVVPCNPSTRRCRLPGDEPELPHGSEKKAP